MGVMCSGYGVLRHFKQYFSYKVSVGFIGGVNRSKGENLRHTVAHNVVSSIHRHERGSNSQVKLW